MLARIPLVTLLCFLLFFELVTAGSTSLDRVRRDAYTTLRAATHGGNGPQLTTVGAIPPGAHAANIPVGNNGADVFAWVSSTPAQESSATSAYIILHGIDRNAGFYYNVLSNANQAALRAMLPGASPNTLLVAPLFFSTTQDVRAYNASSLAWADPNAWTGGDGSTHPESSNVSVFTVLDTLLEKYSKYSGMRNVTFVAHGGGAQVLQRYAVVGKDPPNSNVAVRYVIGDPSSMLYFTRDRPVPFNPATCPMYDDFRYGFSNYTAPYALEPNSPPDLFRRYIARDVRYVIGLGDVVKDEGDQLCAGRATGGPERKDRSLDYWAYLNLLANTTGPTPDYPGFYPALDTRKRGDPPGYLTSTPEERQGFATGQLRHQMYYIDGAGHNADQVYGSGDGQKAIFGAAAPTLSLSGRVSSSSSMSAAGPTGTREPALGGQNGGTAQRIGPISMVGLVFFLAVGFCI